ncbi:MAG: T9SS type A sorting domain-containing protein [Melioribacteraceae bacterium]
MKKHVVHLRLLVIVLIILSNSSFAQWNMASGLDGAEIPAMVSIDSMLFAISADRGVYSKSDTGNWESSLDDKSLHKLCKAGSCLFAYSNYDHTARSYDCGATWEEVYTLNNPVEMFSIDTVIFYGYSGNKKRSFDYGTTYDTVLPPTQDPGYSYLCDDSLLYAEIYDGYETHKLFYSSDYGNTWDSLPTTGLFSQPEVWVQKLQYLNGTFWLQFSPIITGYTGSSLCIYNPNLKIWFNVTNNLPNFTTIKTLFEYYGNIFCSIDGYPVFRFNYADSSWVQFADGTKNVNQFLLHQDELYCATDQGACSLDTNGTWTTFNIGLNHRDISSIDTYGGNIYVTANNELFYSEDKGEHFIRKENAYGFQIITTDSVFYLVSAHEYSMSWDQGSTWHSFSENLEDTFNRELIHLSIAPDYYYIGSWRGLYRSPTDSIVWTKVEGGPIDPDFIVGNVEAIENTVMVGEYLYAQRMYFSDDNGNTFTDYDEFGTLVKNEQSYYLLKDSIFYSDDLVQSWQSMPVNINWFHGQCIDRKGDTLILGGDSNYNPIIRMTWDQGESWIDLIDDLSVLQSWSGQTSVKQLKIVDGRILVGNPRYGLWFRDDILTGANENPVSDETDNISVNVYPNPFSTTTTLEYTLPHASKLEIKFYNHLGKQVDYTNANQSEGKQRVIWKPEKLPSGVYTFTLKTSENTASGQLVLVK